MLAGSGLALLLVAIVLVFFPTDRNQEKASESEPVPSQAQQLDFITPGLKHESKHEEAMSSLPGKSLSGLKEAPPEAVDPSPIESILNDKELSFEESATRLLECTRREDMPMEVRLDALDHAFNLDRWQALTLCMEKPIPTPIAERLVSCIHNLSESPKDQVSACMHLMLHDDAEIREQAQGLLAFLVSAEEHASEPDRLREVADVFLKRPDQGDQNSEVGTEAQ